jgi:hypothetical protein
VRDVGAAKSRCGGQLALLPPRTSRDSMFRPILDYVFPRLNRGIGDGNTAIARALLRGLL